VKGVYKYDETQGQEEEKDEEEVITGLTARGTIPAHARLGRFSFPSVGPRPM
jgi:hypothetical protein